MNWKAVGRFFGFLLTAFGLTGLVKFIVTAHDDGMMLLPAAVVFALGLSILWPRRREQHQ